MQPQRVISQKHAIFDDKLIGKGSTGNVYLGYELQPPHRQRAIKAIDLKKIDNEVTKYLLGCQITALTELSRIDLPGHQSIVKLYDVVPQGDHIYIVTELLEGGTLAEYMKSHPNGLSEEESLHLLRQMLEGYQHIANRSIIHRDIKPDNIIFRRRSDPSKSIAIIDFGYCEMEEVANKPQVYYNVGSPKYMAPEAYKHNIYSEKSDIWAFGVILYQMILGRTCDEGQTMESYLQMITTKGIPLPQNLSTFIKQLLSGMLCQSPSNRYSCFQALKQLKKYQQSTLCQKSRQSQTPGQSLNAQRAKNNPIFQSTMTPLMNVQPPVQQMVSSQFIGMQNLNTAPRVAVIEGIEGPRSDRKLIKSRSANLVPLVTLNSAQPQPQNKLKKVQNIQMTLQDHKQSNIFQKPEHRNLHIEQILPKALQVRSPSPCKIHFKFGNVQPKEGDILEVQRSAYNEVQPFKQENQRQVRVITQPRPQPSDENSIRIFFRQNKVSPQTDNKLIAGRSVQERMPAHLVPQGFVNDRNMPAAHQFVCRGEVKRIYPHRQISLPKTIHH